MNLQFVISCLFLLIISSFYLQNSFGVEVDKFHVLKGENYFNPQACGEKSIVWLSNEKGHLLSHIEVPANGSWGFYLKPAVYEISINTSNFCTHQEKIILNQNVTRFLQLDKKVEK